MSNHTAKAFAGGLVLLFFVGTLSAYAQMPPGMQEVSGEYTNSGAGVKVTFPDGWSGFEMSGSFGTLVATSPGGMSESDSETMKAITLMIVAKSESQDPREPSSFSNDVNNCNDPSITSRTAAGVQGIQVTAECPETSQTYRMVAVETASNWIVVMYMAPTADFQSEVDSFDSTVASLTANGAVNTEGPSDDGSSSDGSDGESGSPTVSTVSVTVEGSPIDVSVTSSSTISAFEINEESKTLSFRTSGTGTETVIAVGAVLEGPYTVMVDGQATEAEESQEDGVSTLTVPHSSGDHEVTVTGTQVVPEFPVAMIGVIAALIGVVAVVGRTKVFRSKI